MLHGFNFSKLVVFVNTNFYVPYFSDHRAHLKSFNLLKNRKCAL